MKEYAWQLLSTCPSSSRYWTRKHIRRQIHFVALLLKVAQCLHVVLQAQILSVQLLNIPSLFKPLGQHADSAKTTASPLSSQQDSLVIAFKGWLGRGSNSQYGAATLTKRHGPALLGFAAVAALSKDIPGLQGDVCQQMALPHFYY